MTNDPDDSPLSWRSKVCVGLQASLRRSPPPSQKWLICGFAVTRSRPTPITTATKSISGLGKGPSNGARLSVRSKESSGHTRQVPRSLKAKP